MKEKVEENEKLKEQLKKHKEIYCYTEEDL